MVEADFSPRIGSRRRRSLLLTPEAFIDITENGTMEVLAAGLLVGLGTRIGSGCTSGHGVCGIGRLSIRSLVATLVFVGSGMLTVFFSGGLQ